MQDTGASDRGVMNLGRLLSDTARRLGPRDALVWGNRAWTWRELDDRANALTAALKDLGVGKGDKILVHAKNSNAYVEIMFAAFKLGAVWVPTNVRLSPAEVVYLAENSQACVLIYDEVFADYADAVLDSKTCRVKTVISTGQARAGERSYEDLIEGALGAPAWEEEVAHGDPCWFFYTSGTTGRPKGAVLTHGQMAYIATNHIADLMPGISSDEASLVVAPLSHGAGAHILPQIARGVKSVLTSAKSFDEAECWRLLEEHKVSNIFTVPTIITRLCRHPSVDEYDHGSLKYVIYAGAPMYREDQKHCLNKLGKVLVQYYGLGEVTGCITVLPPDAHDLDDGKMKVGSCGFPRTGMEIAIKDPEGRRLGPRETGEICARGLGVFAGYWNNPEANAKALQGGWFHTGDLGHLDEEGFLYITGRASDMYISGGSNVYPREAEEVLLTHPAVSETAILGVPDPKWGESGVAVVILEAGQSADEAELLAWFDGKLAKYKRPRRVFFWDELPKSGYGKVPKHLVRKALFERGDLKEGEGL